ncbi:MAG TPA: hypothetical protein VK586_23395 [Streptosporangiaceae bacterium]|nr:hypothetical protein [Streptosporangiaceae bacterium]
MGKHNPDGTVVYRRDHLWVLFVIGTCALFELWGSWLGIASVSGFPHYGRVTTGWVLFVATEAYWGYALFAWLAGAPGPRSRKFAMHSAIAMFALSLAGQEAGHLLAAAHRTAPWYVVAFVTPLPLIAVGLIAILVHLRQADREAAAEAARAAAEADELTVLRAELDAARGAHGTDVRGLREELEAERIARETDARETAATAAEAAAAEARLRELELACGSLEAELRTVREASRNEARTLRASLEDERRDHGEAERGAVLLPVIQSQLNEARAAASALRAELEEQRTGYERAVRDAREAVTEARSQAEAAAARADTLARKLAGPARRSRTAPAQRGTAPRPAAGTAPEDDLELEARALKLLATDLNMTGAEVGRQLGVTEGYGRKLRRRLAGERPSEDEADRPGDRAGTAAEDRSEDRA